MELSLQEREAYSQLATQLKINAYQELQKQDPSTWTPLDRRFMFRFFREHLADRYMCDACQPRYLKLYPPEERRVSDRCIHWDIKLGLIDPRDIT